MIMIWSTAGLRGAPHIAHCPAAKHGLVGIMRSLAAELAPHWIRVNTRCGGRIQDAQRSARALG